MKIKHSIKRILPDFMLRRLRLISPRKVVADVEKTVPPQSGQDLEIYWDANMAEVLEQWGIGTAWSEIEFLLVNLSGSVLDIACGTGKNIEMLSRIAQIEVHGCDISDYLIQKAIRRGIPASRLQICDATKMGYVDNSFDYAYSIGSIEHFTENGIHALINECYRITKYASFHMLPVSRSGKNEGWMKTVQSFHNNTAEWWLDKFKAVYKTVYVLDSDWKDSISVGKWFICVKEVK